MLMLNNLIGRLCSDVQNELWKPVYQGSIKGYRWRFAIYHG